VKYTSENIYKYTLFLDTQLMWKEKVFICHKNVTMSVVHSYCLKSEPIFYLINSEKDLKGTFTLDTCGKGLCVL